MQWSDSCSRKESQKYQWTQECKDESSQIGELICLVINRTCSVELFAAEGGSTEELTPKSR